MLNEIAKNPYRLFFPLGLISLFLGVGLWVPNLFDSDHYPVYFHKMLMVNGFMGFYMAGFLMTAIPQFSGTHHATKFEVSLYLLMTLAFFIFNPINDFNDHEYAVIVQALLIIKFIGFRFLKAKTTPPYTFVFVLSGLLLWLMSGVFPSYLPDAFQHEAFFLFLIIGVGSRLIPGILGHTDIVKKQRAVYEKSHNLVDAIPVYLYIALTLLVLSFFLPETWAFLLRFFVLLFFGLKYWKLYKLPKIKTSLTYSIWLSAWTILLYPLIGLIWTEAMIHAQHMFFISGVCLLTILVSTRVVRAHAKVDASLENHQGLYYVTGLLIVASSTRVSAVLIEDSYHSHLSYSAFLLIIGILFWCIFYARLFFVYKRE